MSGLAVEFDPSQWPHLKLGHILVLLLTSCTDFCKHATLALTPNIRHDDFVLLTCLV